MRFGAGVLPAGLAVAAVLFAQTALRAAGEIASAGPALSASPSTLADLPRLAPVANPEPDPTSVKEVDRLLERLCAEDDRARADARVALGDAQRTFVPAIHHRIRELHAAFDRSEASRIVEAARKAGRKSTRGADAGTPRKPRKEKARTDDDEGDQDWLDFMLATPKPKSKTWRDVTSLLGMERMLTAIGTTPAVRELVGLYASFGELLRIDLQRQVAKLRDKAVPALIEARQHDAKAVQRWANKELDVLGRAIPGEAVASSDTQILADVLRAYGRTRDVDALRVILSYANSERGQLREAAREATVAIGEPGVWQIRDQYLGLTGEKPPHAWSWDRLTRELFALYDRGRLSEINNLMDEGRAAASAGKVLDAASAFDRVLARAPLFDRRNEMVKTYFDAALQVEGAQPAEALAILRKAWRLDPSGQYAKPIQSEIAYLEGILSVREGLPDKTAFERAIFIDPTNDRARSELAALQDRALQRATRRWRYGLALPIALLAVLSTIVLTRLRGSRKPLVQSPGPP
jgi:tetratricopeptide (TPR) repeat protein